MTTETLGEAFPKEQERCRELLGIYKSLPNNAGFFGAAMIEQTLKEADAAAMSGDVVRMLKVYEEMKGVN